jgi:hypothetical protein
VTGVGLLHATRIRTPGVSSFIPHSSQAKTAVSMIFLWLIALPYRPIPQNLLEPAKSSFESVKIPIFKAIALVW